MKYCSSLNPKWMVVAAWRKRRLVFYALSAVSLVGNAVVLAESLEVRVTLKSLLHRLLPQVRDVGELLVQRPVLVMLLNLIMLRMLVTSGLLDRGGTPKQHEGRGMQAAGDMGRQPDKTVPISDDGPETHDYDDSMFKKRGSSAILFSCTEPGGATASSAIAQGDADKHTTIKRAVRPLKRASLFTIEPLDSNNIEPPSTITHPQPPIIILGTAQPKMGMRSPHSDMRAHGLSIDDPQSDTSFVPHTSTHFNDDGGSYYFDLNRQEFNERVETFITKFKRNLTMQRQDSLNRLLGLVGGGIKR